MLKEITTSSIPITEYDDGICDYTVTTENRDISGNVISNILTSASSCLLPDFVTSDHFNDASEAIVGIANSSNAQNAGWSKLELPGHLQFIGNKAFEWGFFKEIKLPHSLLSIGNGSFQNCNYITELYIPDSVTYIGPNAFNACTKLSRIKLSCNAIAIGFHAFYGCTSITELTIPEGVKKLNLNCFYGCINLKKVILSSTLNAIHTTAFDNCPNAIFYVESGSYAEEWCKNNNKQYECIDN